MKIEKVKYVEQEFQEKTIENERENMGKDMSLYSKTINTQPHKLQ